MNKKKYNLYDIIITSIQLQHIQQILNVKCMYISFFDIISRNKKHRNEKRKAKDNQIVIVLHNKINF